MRVGYHEFKLEEARGLLQDYAVRHADTVRFYDLAGDPDGHPGPGSAAEPPDEVTLADIGRLVIINAGLAADDVITLMDIDASPEFAAVPATARLEDCVPGSALYTAATALYEKYRPLKDSKIGQAKRSKLLHLKRPWLVPIADSRTMTAYRHRADAWASRLGIASGHWEAVREDLVNGAGELHQLSDELAAHPAQEIQRLSRLTCLRLLDILAWTIGDS